MIRKMESLIESLQSTKTEEDVKARYAKHFTLDYDTSDKHDLYNDSVLFEFKFDANLSSLGGRAKVFAQVLYYVYRLKFKQAGQFAKKQIPPFLCLADKNEAMITETAKWKEFYSSDKYDWDLQPSSPDPHLVDDLRVDKKFRELEVYKLPQKFDCLRFEETLKKILDNQLTLELRVDKKIITEDNFEEVFQYWDSIFHNDVQNGLKSSRYFVCDIQKGKSEYSEMKGGVNFYIDDAGKTVFKPILKSKYDKFWGIYEKITNPKEIGGILAKIDRLTDDTLRRFEGQFFTPLDFAKKGLEYLEKTLGKNWYRGCKIWDMCAGTGNLQYYIPNEYLHNVYASTLVEDEMEHMRRLFALSIPKENIFQYDYLNDDVHRVFVEGQTQINFSDEDWKLPKKLRDDLANPKNKWVILINPPYATSQDGGGGLSRSREEKSGVSKTKIRDEMLKTGLGDSSQELFTQFLFRIEREFRGKSAHLALFSKMKYVNSFANQGFRKKLFNFIFKKGFIFSAKNFYGTNGNFPVGFLIWDLQKREILEKQKVVVDVFETTIKDDQMVRGSAIKIGKKEFPVEQRSYFLSSWVKRFKNVEIAVPLTSAIKIKSEDARLDRLAKNAIGYLAVNANDNQNQNKTVLFSTVFQQGNGHSITSEIFIQSMVVHAVRRVPKATWINDRDQFMQPKKKLSEEFENDCIIWGLFSGSNQTSSLKDVKYKGETYQIINQFFPFESRELATWKIQNPEIEGQIPDENRFVAEFLKEKKLSEESLEVLRIGKQIYQEFYKNFNNLDRSKYKLQTWDAGWWQIRMALSEQNLAEELFAELKIAHKKLKENILKGVYGYGFLGEEIIAEATEET